MFKYIRKNQKKVLAVFSIGLMVAFMLPNAASRMGRDQNEVATLYGGDVKIDINPKDVEEFGSRGGGPGGQNVNKVETGWFIRHKPSGLQFKMTEHKSQTQNKERAWALLRATLHEAEQAKQHANLTSARKAMMGSGDRSQRIRTYNFPQNRCTDHRLGGEGGGEKNFHLEQTLAGDLDPVVHALWELDKQQRLEDL